MGESIQVLLNRFVIGVGFNSMHVNGPDEGRLGSEQTESLSVFVASNTPRKSYFDLSNQPFISLSASPSFPPV